MINNMTRCIKIDDWIFEVKMVRALRVSHYGDPYSAITNITFNGDKAIIDGVMLKDQDTLNDSDYQILKAFCLKMNVNHIDVEPNQNHHLPNPLDYSQIANNR